MGALHAGHVRLLETAREECAVVAASIFVNPTQFSDAADLAAYPRQEREDTALVAAAGVDVLFVPSAGEMYAAGEATTVDLSGPAMGLEATHRPGHFAGVALVCLKLFSIVRPDVVFLGQKDAQQVAVISQLIADLKLGVRVHIVPTARADDGLALSSRNVRLSAEERRQARAVPAALRAAVAAYRRGQDPVEAALHELQGLTVEYVDIARFSATPTLVIAVRAGATRLIDNVPLDYPEGAGLSI
jgi:pantoate--beta-alanine ligase